MHNTQVLTEAGCENAVTKLRRARNHWVARDSQGDFLTLGWASYLDASQLDSGGGRGAWSDTNQILTDLFSAELERVRAAIELWTGQQAVFLQDVPLPGFHIWLPHAIPTLPSASVHFDLQYEALNRHGVLPPPEDTLSFTLPVALPMAGGGLTYWKDVILGVSNIDWSAGRTLTDVTSEVPTSHIEYSLGELVLHSGKIAHQIAAISVVRPEDMRITLQGHGLLSQSRWILYW